LRPLNPGAAAARPAGVRPPLALNIAGEPLLRAVMAANPGPHVMLEVPSFMVADPAHAAALRELAAAGTPLMLKGRPLSPLPPEMLACFSHSVVDASDERRSVNPPTPGLRQVTTVQDGVRTAAELDLAFQRGAVAVLGWQFEDPLPVASTSRRSVPADVQVVMELIGAVDREEHVNKLEGILKRDPTLAFRLMRYLNSPAFGLSVEINSFGHALMLLGYVRLKRWLALLLASSTKDANAKPLLFAAVRRGLIMEELVRSQGDAEMRGEMFICGVFSLLDRLLRQPFSELLASVPVPERVQAALRDDDGPFQPFLELVRAIESSAVFDIREHSERLLLGPAEVNRALLTALRGARALD
jgi:EAL and modified HD-GYP domain-containing signal transduction protein